jgi:hypothetical protein
MLPITLVINVDLQKPRFDMRTEKGKGERYQSGWKWNLASRDCVHGWRILGSFQASVEGRLSEGH